VDESRFPPYVKEQQVADSMLQLTAGIIAGKLGVAQFTTAPYVDYRLITMFGKPKIKEPENKKDENNFTASLLSFITRATTGNEVLWRMQVQIKQKGTTVYTKDITHELISYDTTYGWFTPETFLYHYKVLLQELMDQSPPIAYRYVLGSGVDYVQLLNANSTQWKFKKNASPFGYGTPDFGPYTTVAAEKIDTADVIRTSARVGKETSITTISPFSGDKRQLFEQYNIIDRSKLKMARLALSNAGDTAEAVFAIGIMRRERSRTVLGSLFGTTGDFISGNDSEGSNLLGFRRDITGLINTGMAVWEFAIENYNLDGTFEKGYLATDGEEYLLTFSFGNDNHMQFVVVNAAGEYVAILDNALFETFTRIDQRLAPQHAHAIASLFALFSSVKNIQ
jgi:hypothetical protein